MNINIYKKILYWFIIFIQKKFHLPEHFNFLKLSIIKDSNL